MPRFAANLSMLFAELPFMERFEAARAAGFEAVEYLFPYEYEAAELKRALNDAGLKQVLSSVEQAAEIVREVGSDNLFIQYDLYHQSRSGGELLGTFERFRHLIRHMQVAGNPGRHEPDSGEIDYGFVFRELDRLGYEGWIGAEYVPANGTAEGLGWFGPWKGRP